MKISVIMVDGSFRENVYAAEYFSKQEFSSNEYEVIWVEYFDNVNSNVTRLDGVTSISLNRSGEYHSSYCFNEGIKRAKGDLLVIPDADVIVKPNFLSRLWEIHERNKELACYIRRYDEFEDNRLVNLSFKELENKCVLKNPSNYGGCLSVRKKWMLSINGYEMHPVFSTGFHANGLDIYVRLKNLGLSIMWEPALKLYHPWHPYTLEYVPEYDLQKQFIRKRELNLEFMAHYGINENVNLAKIPYDVALRQYKEDAGRLSLNHNNGNHRYNYKIFKRARKKIKKYLTSFG